MDTHVLDDADWSRGPWEKSCKTRLTRQREATDCGVACLAMVAKISYEMAYTTVSGLGCDKGPRSMATNFRQLELGLRQHGVIAKRSRWGGWEGFQGMGVLKVQVTTQGVIEPQLKQNWHWVVAERHPVFGIVLRDPDCPLVALELPPLDVMHQELSRYHPYGSMITIVGQSGSADFPN